jgi:hypothetical protein
MTTPEAAPDTQTPDRRPGIGGIRHGRGVTLVRTLTPDRVVGVARSAARTYGSATARSRPLPEFLVIGAKKGGTTSVANWLSKHPHVLPLFPRYQRIKSPHYFDINFWRGESWYRSHFHTEAVRRLHQRRHGVRPISGESSPYYLFHPAAAERIHQTAPTIKMVAVLREPVSRAYSNYWDRRATGHEDLPTFEAAIDAEPERLAGITDEFLRAPDAYSHDHDNHSYLARGRYAEQLRRYLDLFDRDQLLVLSAGAVLKDPVASFARLQAFLGLPPVEIDLAQYNVRSGYPPLDTETRERLRAYYAPHNHELYELLGEDLGW